MNKLLAQPALPPFLGWLLVVGFFLSFSPQGGLFSIQGAVSVLEVSALLGLIAMGATLLMIGGEFDLSVGSQIGFSGVLLGIGLNHFHWSFSASLLVVLIVSALVGLLNGLLVTKTGLPSFIVTLAAMFSLRGLSLGLTRSITGRTQFSELAETIDADGLSTIFRQDSFQGFFSWLGELGYLEVGFDGQPLLGGLPPVVLWCLVLAIGSGLLLKHHRLGNWIFAVGGNGEAARRQGVPVAKLKIALFIQSSLLASLFAVLQVCEVGSADTTRGVLKEFEAIIAVVIGGTLLTGGYGTLVGALLGALIFGTVQMGIFYSGADTDWFKLFMGLMMLVAVLFNNYVRNRAAQRRL